MLNQYSNWLDQKIHEVLSPYGPHGILEQVHWSADKVHFQMLVSMENLVLFGAIVMEKKSYTNLRYDNVHLVSKFRSE